MATANDVASVMPKVKVLVNKKVHDLQEFEDRVVAFVKRGKPKATNAKGAREILDVASNTAYGAKGENGVFRQGGGHKSVEMVIRYVETHISGYATGEQIRNVKAQALGGMLGELMGRDVKVFRKQEDINFCRGDGLWQRGEILGTPTVAGGISTVTFTNTEGNRFVEPGGIYLVHNKTSGAVIGSVNGYECLSRIGRTQARFAGDLNALGDLTGRILCPIGTGDGESTFGRAPRVLSFFTGTSGDYYGIDRDVIDNAQGLRVDGAGENITHPMLEKGTTLYMYRWNSQDVDVKHVDLVPPAQVAVYKLNAYALRRLDTESYRVYDGAIKKIKDGDRMIIVDANIPPDKWYRMYMECIYNYVLSEPGVWDLDDREVRPQHVNGSIRDGVQWHLFGENNYGCTMPGEQIEYHTLGRSGVFDGVTGA